MTVIANRFTSLATQVEDLSEPFIKCEPLLYPTATLVHAMQGAPPTESVLRWGEANHKPLYTQINHGGGYTTETDLTVDSTVGMSAGCTLFVPRTGELIIVGDITSSTRIGGGGTACTRGALGGATSAGGLTDNEVLEIRGTELTEGFAYSSVPIIANNADGTYNEFSRVGYGVQISGTQAALEKRGDKAYGYGNEDDYDEALTRLKRDINVSLLRGVRYNNSLTGTSKVTCAGGIPYYAYNSSAAAGDISDRTTWENLMKPLAMYSPGEYLCPSSWITMQAIQRLYQGENIGDFTGKIIGSTGIKVREITHPMGAVFNYYYDPTLTEIYDNSTSKWTGAFEVFPTKYTKIHYNRPIGRYEVPPTTDAVTDIVMAEWTFSFKGAKRFGVYTGVTALT